MTDRNPYRERPWTGHYAPGVPHRVEIPTEPVWTVLDAAAERFPRRTALHFYGKNLSYRELQEEVNAFASSLASLGVGKGDRVALYLVNSPQFVVAYFGVLKAGGTVVPVSPVYSSSELGFQLRDSGASYIVCQDVLYGNLERTELPLKGTIVTGAHEYLPVLKGALAKKPPPVRTRDPPVGKTPPGRPRAVLPRRGGPREGPRRPPLHGRDLGPPQGSPAFPPPPPGLRRPAPGVLPDPLRRRRPSPQPFPSTTSTARWRSSSWGSPSGPRSSSSRPWISGRSSPRWSARG